MQNYFWSQAVQEPNSVRNKDQKLVGCFYKDGKIILQAIPTE